LPGKLDAVSLFSNLLVDILQGDSLYIDVYDIFLVNINGISSLALTVSSKLFYFEKLGDYWKTGVSAKMLSFTSAFRVP
jgi:hypothetical protein